MPLGINLIAQAVRAIYFAVISEHQSRWETELEKAYNDGYLEAQYQIYLKDKYQAII